MKLLIVKVTRARYIILVVMDVRHARVDMMLVVGCEIYSVKLSRFFMFVGW